MTTTVTSYVGVRLSVDPRFDAKSWVSGYFAGAGPGLFWSGMLEFVPSPDAEESWALVVDQDGHGPLRFRTFAEVREWVGEK